MNLMQVVLILTIFIPMIVYSRKITADELLRGLEEFFPESRTIAKLNSQCDWITYDSVLGAGVTYDAKSYPCEKVTVVGGYEVMTNLKLVPISSKTLSTDILLLRQISDIYFQCKI
ncbi:hypothetical protein I4U23_016735 [Adineta vaga]|nr:hypothetical protein I4U23_016735 [Adineta vaga]